MEREVKEKLAMLGFTLKAMVNSKEYSKEEIGEYVIEKIKQADCKIK